MSASFIVPVILFWIAEFVFFPIFIKAQWPDPTYKSFTFKMLSASVFLGYGLFLACTMGWSKFTLFMVLGLIGGWLGDMFLHLEPFIPEDSKHGNDITFVLGLLAFLAGHIMYVIAYITGINTLGFTIPWFTYVIAAAIVAVCIAVKFIAKIKLGIAAVPVLLYAMTISTMLSMACVFGVSVMGTSAVFGIILIVGAILFVVSDGTLVFCIFGSEKAKTNYPLKVVNLTTYFIAQMLLASTIFFFAQILA